MNIFEMIASSPSLNVSASTLTMKELNDLFESVSLGAAKPEFWMCVRCEKVLACGEASLWHVCDDLKSEG